MSTYAYEYALVRTSLNSGKLTVKWFQFLLFPFSLLVNRSGTSHNLHRLGFSNIGWNDERIFRHREREVLWCNRNG